MKKLKITFLAFFLGAMSAFAISDDPLCQAMVYGYFEETPPGYPDWQNVIPGRFNYDYTCHLLYIEICRYIKKADGTFLPCPGKLFYYNDSILIR